jgi:hypothetical protein
MTIVSELGTYSVNAPLDVVTVVVVVCANVWLKGKQLRASKAAPTAVVFIFIQAIRAGERRWSHVINTRPEAHA